METTQLEDRTVIVTGASAGIGKATATRFAQAGATVVLAARRQDRLADLANHLETEYGTESCAIPTDVRYQADVDQLVTDTVDRFGQLDVVVSNAGLARGSEVASLSMAQYRTMLETNVDGTFFVTQAALPYLQTTNGHLIFVGSFAGKYPRSFNPVYAATKWWVRGFAHSLMGQVGADGIAISLINPSEVRTEFGDTEGTPFLERFDKWEVVEPTEVADAIVFAASQQNATMSEIDVNRRDKFGGF